MLDLAVQLWKTGFEAGMADALVFDMPVELGLELMTFVRPDLANAQWDFVDDIVDKVDGVRLRVPFRDFEVWDTGRIVNGGVLEPPDLLSRLSLKCQEFDVHLIVMSGKLLGMAFSMELLHAQL